MSQVEVLGSPLDHTQTQTQTQPTPQTLDPRPWPPEGLLMVEEGPGSRVQVRDLGLRVEDH
eukprot:520420-Rhodomonas_salina.1